MSVTFVRTGERCYAVRAAVEGMPIVEMDPAPGYDALVPHDLQHFIVERALGIEGAIYGQLLAECQLEMHPTKAVGGTAGTFHTICSAPPPASFERPEKARSQIKQAHVESAGRLCTIRAGNLCLLVRLAQSLRRPGTPGAGAEDEGDSREYAAGNVARGKGSVHAGKVDCDSVTVLGA
jgi:hypothetical protein